MTRTNPVRARKLAEQCFNVARSTTFEGERTAAIARGEAIASRAGLSLDLFDIPGRTKPDAQPKAEARPSDAYDLDEMLRRAKTTRAGWDRDEWYRSSREKAFDDLAATMRRKAAEAGARPGETAYEARRRAFDEATANPHSEHYRRVDLEARWPSVDAVVNALRARRIGIGQVSDWQRPGERHWVVEIGQLMILDEWQLRELADKVCG